MNFHDFRVLSWIYTCKQLAYRHGPGCPGFHGALEMATWTLHPRHKSKVTKFETALNIQGMVTYDLDFELEHDNSNIHLKIWISHNIYKYRHILCPSPTVPNLLLNEDESTILVCSRGHSWSLQSIPIIQIVFFSCA